MKKNPLKEDSTTLLRGPLNNNNNNLVVVNSSALRNVTMIIRLSTDEVQQQALAGHIQEIPGLLRTVTTPKTVLLEDNHIIERVRRSVGSSTSFSSSAGIRSNPTPLLFWEHKKQKHTSAIHSTIEILEMVLELLNDEDDLDDGGGHDYPGVQ